MLEGVHLKRLLNGRASIEQVERSWWRVKRWSCAANGQSNYKPGKDLQYISVAHGMVCDDGGTITRKAMAIANALRFTFYLKRERRGQWLTRAHLSPPAPASYTQQDINRLSGRIPEVFQLPHLLPIKKITDVQPSLDSGLHTSIPIIIGAAVPRTDGNQYDFPSRSKRIISKPRRRSEHAPMRSRQTHLSLLLPLITICFLNTPSKTKPSLNAARRLGSLKALAFHSTLAYPPSSSAHFMSR